MEFRGDTENRLMEPFSPRFQECLRHHDRAGLRMIPKADLHNHFVLGGSRSFLKEHL